jgi:tRNA-2-methylthio-N6-dimethylallyladenosine synthase
MFPFCEGVSDKKNMYYGYSDTNKLINFVSDKELISGEIVKVKITDSKTWSLDGETI